MKLSIPEVKPPEIGERSRYMRIFRRRSIREDELPEIVKKIFLGIGKDLDTLYAMTHISVEGFRFYEDGIYLLKSDGGKRRNKWEKAYEWDIVGHYFRELQ